MTLNLYLAFGLVSLPSSFHYPLLRRQLGIRQMYSAKNTIWKCSFLEKTILPKKTILPPLSDCTVHISQLFFTDQGSGRGNQRFKG